MSLLARVKMALAGFETLFAGAVTNSFANVCSAALASALELGGHLSEPLTDNPNAREIVFAQACLNALDTIESVLTLTPVRRRMEAGVETETTSFSKSLEALRKNYKARITEAKKADAEDGTSFVVFDGVDMEVDDPEYTVWDLPGMS